VPHFCVAVNVGRASPVARSYEGGGRRAKALLAPRHFSVIPAGCASTWAILGEPRILLVYLHRRLLDRIVESAYDRDPGSVVLVPRLAAHDGLVEQLSLGLMSALVDEGDWAATAGRSADSLYAESLAVSLAGHRVRLHSTLVGGRESPQHHLPRSRVGRLTDLIESRLAEGDLHLEDLAAEAGMHPQYLPRAFRRVFGVSPHQYVLQRRVERAKQLLRETDLTVAEVAARGGFASQSHLCMRFKRATGVTPRRYRDCA